MERLVTRNLPLIAEQSRPLVLLAAIIAIAALGLVTVVDDETGRVVGLSVFLALMLVITGLIYLTTRATTGGDETTDPAAVGTALRKANGSWWQLVVNDESPGLSVITVDLSVVPARSLLGGTKYTPEGKEMARWSTEAVAVAKLKPVEVFYYWHGSYARGTERVSGVGVFEFAAAADEDAQTGTGWFTTGDVERGDFSVSSKVHLRRVTADDDEVLRQGGAPMEELLSRCYQDWMARFES